MNTDKDPSVRLAVFDLDGTSISGQSGALFSRWLFSRGRISKRAAMRLVWWGTRYVLHLPHSQEESREVIFHELGQLDPCEVEQLMEQFHREVLLPLYRKDALAEVEKRQAEGCKVLLVSATFEGIAKEAGSFMGVDGVVATRMQKDSSGHYTGYVDGPVIEGSAKPFGVARWAQSNLAGRDWQLRYAYGDHHSDEALLASAEYACAVCPDASLRRVAKKRGWNISDWE